VSLATQRLLEQLRKQAKPDFPSGEYDQGALHPQKYYCRLRLKRGGDLYDERFVFIFDFPE